MRQYCEETNWASRCTNLTWSFHTASTQSSPTEGRIAAVQIDPVTGHSPSARCIGGLIPRRVQVTGVVEGASFRGGSNAGSAVEGHAGAARRLVLAADGSSGARRSPEPRRTGGMAEELAG